MTFAVENFRLDGQAAAASCDVTEETAVQFLVDFTLVPFGHIVLLVNNAGGGGPKPFDMPRSDFPDGKRTRYPKGRGGFPEREQPTSFTRPTGGM